MNRISIVSNRLYKHRRFRIYHTTYDLRRQDETISYRRRPNIMLLNHSAGDAHPYLYARVIGIYHLRFIYMDGNLPYTVQKMNILHVRWFCFDEKCRWDGQRNDYHVFIFAPLVILTLLDLLILRTSSGLPFSSRHSYTAKLIHTCLGTHPLECSKTLMVTRSGLKRQTGNFFM